MSWSNSWIGKPAAIIGAMDRYSAMLTGNSKEEFDHAAPALKTLLQMNDDTSVVHLTASGHAYTSQGADDPNPRLYSQCVVALNRLGALSE